MNACSRFGQEDWLCIHRALFLAGLQKPSFCYCYANDRATLTCGCCLSCVAILLHRDGVGDRAT